MKIAHIADLHFGKNVNGFSLIEDQKYIVNKIIEILKDKKVDTLIVAGDVYDKSVPSSEAMNLFDEFINALISLNIRAFIISGNHDSSDRLSFASDVLKRHNIHIVTRYCGSIEQVEVDGVVFYLLPFIKPLDVKKYFEEDVISYDDALRKAIEKESVDTKKCNIMISHQFITSSSESLKSDSEVYQVGTLDNIDYSVFKDFDYTALGHLHRPQKVGGENIRYSGSILKYSFSECNDVKSVVLFDTDDFEMEFEPLIPRRDMKVITGTFEEVLKSDYSEDYYKVVLTDKYKGIDVFAKLRRIFPNLMKLEYKSESADFVETEVRKEKSPMEIIKAFYRMQKGHDIEDASLEIVEKEIGDIKR